MEYKSFFKYCQNAVDRVTQFGIAKIYHSFFGDHYQDVKEPPRTYYDIGCLLYNQHFSDTEAGFEKIEDCIDFLFNHEYDINKPKKEDRT